MVQILIGAISLYCLAILLMIVGFLALRLQKPIQKITKTTFSICIAFRNESENLPALLKSLKALNYPKDLFEIILVNDHSTDNSIEIITDFSLKNPHFEPKIKVLSQKLNSASGKKAALNLAFKNAKNEFIVTTDADCIVPKTWLNDLNAFILLKQKTFIAAPVALLATATSFLNQFQQLDFLSLQGATIGAFGIKKPFLCNGANLAFSKAEFFRLKGYEGNLGIASGDDIFLMQKFLQDNTKNVGYLKSKNSIVLTQPQHSWNQLINQRKRWAAKASKYQSFTASLISWTVFLANFSFILAIFYLQTSNFLIGALLLKILVDFLIIVLTARFFGKKSYLLGYLGSFLFYPFFTIYIAISSQLQPFIWKERQLKK